MEHGCAHKSDVNTTVTTFELDGLSDFQKAKYGLDHFGSDSSMGFNQTLISKPAEVYVRGKDVSHTPNGTAQKLLPKFMTPQQARDLHGITLLTNLLEEYRFKSLDGHGCRIQVAGYGGAKRADRRYVEYLKSFVELLIRDREQFLMFRSQIKSDKHRFVLITDKNEAPKDDQSVPCLDLINIWEQGPIADELLWQDGLVRSYCQVPDQISTVQHVAAIRAFVIGIAGTHELPGKVTGTVIKKRSRAFRGYITFTAIEKIRSQIEAPSEMEISNNTLRANIWKHLTLSGQDLSAATAASRKAGTCVANPFPRFQETWYLTRAQRRYLHRAANGPWNDLFPGQDRYTVPRPYRLQDLIAQSLLHAEQSVMALSDQLRKRITDEQTEATLATSNETAILAAIYKATKALWDLSYFLRLFGELIKHHLKGIEHALSLSCPNGPGIPMDFLRANALDAVRTSSGSVLKRPPCRAKPYCSLKAPSSIPSKDEPNADQYETLSLEDAWEKDSWAAAAWKYCQRCVQQMDNADKLEAKAKQRGWCKILPTIKVSLIRITGKWGNLDIHALGPNFQALLRRLPSIVWKDREKVLREKFPGLFEPDLGLASPPIHCGSMLASLCLLAREVESEKGPVVREGEEGFKIVREVLNACAHLRGIVVSSTGVCPVCSNCLLRVGLSNRRRYKDKKLITPDEFALCTAMALPPFTLEDDAERFLTMATQLLGDRCHKARMWYLGR